MAPRKGQSQKPGNKSTRRPHHTLVSQGRCFKCHKKGHLARECPRTPGLKPNLADLPIEILEQICQHLTDARWSYIEALPRLQCLRLVCRRLNDKLHDYYGRTAFRFLLVRISYRGLQLVNEIAQSSFAENVKKIFLCEREEVFESKKEYDKASKAYYKGVWNPSKRYTVDPRLKECLEQEDEMAYIDRSGTMGIMLTLALLKMRNVETIELICTQKDHKSVRRMETGTGESTTQTFSAVIAALSHAKLNLQKLLVHGLSGFDTDEGISLQALAMPQDALDRMSELRDLQLVLEANDNAFINPMLCDKRLATFLCSCPKLVTLNIEFGNNWAYTAKVLHQVARKVKLPRLKDLKLVGIQCDTEDLSRFLVSHLKLETLLLRDVDLSGEDGVAYILKLLETQFHHLKAFKCSQIAHKGFHTYFETLGQISTADGCDMVISDPFYDNFVTVGKPNKFLGEAEEWEGVQQKIGLLFKDLRVSNEHWHSERAYQWHLWEAET